MPVLFVLFYLFAGFSLLSLGGVNAVLVGMHHQAVSVHHWMTDEQFTAIYAIGRCLPGPSSLFVGMIGWHVAGFAGALVTLFGTFAPTSAIAYGVTRSWMKGGDGVWHKRLHEALVPLGVGLFLAGGIAITRSSVSDATGLVIVGVTTIVFLTLKPNPLLVMGALAAAGGIAKMAGLT